MQYVPWNWHEPSKGIFDFESEGRNITRFVEIAQEVGLLVLMRAGPFMCGEWEFGGLPFYLINETQAYRTYDDVYISYVDRWWGEQLLPRLAPQLYSNGGPIVMVQVENEYGSFGDVGNNPLDLQVGIHCARPLRCRHDPTAKSPRHHHAICL
mmetsp:Transcript_67502/g.186265  ORF Transcript_67502/g.186265 Transcript_67502/m.186265 type:complete len:153 (+) Transcript_67502:713-1171(+)